MLEARSQKTNVFYKTYSIYIIKPYPKKRRSNGRIIPELVEMEYEK